MSPKNKTFQLLLVCVACAMLFACKQDNKTSKVDVDKKVDPLLMESELRILSLPGRIESGKSNKDIDWVTPFEAATGCKVKATTVESYLYIEPSIRSQDVDLVISEVQTAELMQPIEISRLRSFKELDKRFVGDMEIEISKVLYVPFQWQLRKPEPPETEMVMQEEDIYMPAKAKNINCAYAWIEWSLSPKVQADIAASLGTIPVVPAACSGSDALGDGACKQRMSETLEIVSDEVPAESPADSRTP